MRITSSGSTACDATTTQLVHALFKGWHSSATVLSAVIPRQAAANAWFLRLGSTSCASRNTNTVRCMRRLFHRLGLITVVPHCAAPHSTPGRRIHRVASADRPLRGSNCPAAPFSWRQRPVAQASSPLLRPRPQALALMLLPERSKLRLGSPPRIACLQEHTCVDDWMLVGQQPGTAEPTTHMRDIL